MSNDAEAVQPAAGNGPTGLHHHAYVCADQERTRHFYEDLVGIPLTAFWIEDEDIMGERHVFSHAFFGLPGGGALAFFNFADAAQQERYAAKQQGLFVHLSLAVDRAAQRAIRARLEGADIAVWDADHGYTYSIYVTDPDGLLVEFSADPPGIEAVNAEQRTTAHASLARWMAGGREANNDVRHLVG
jgi:catechol 2,3-dioxygenase-like lactoylglutathione lyase family enzyme